MLLLITKSGKENREVHSSPGRTQNSHEGGYLEASRRWPAGERGKDKQASPKLDREESTLTIPAK